MQMGRRMSSFSSPLTVTKVADMIWMTEEPFVFETDTDYIEVPDCFHTDFASVPRFLWSLFPPDGQYSQAAVLHDYLYQSHIRPRKRSDELFLEAMEVLNVKKWVRNTLFFFVRLFGFRAYGRLKNV